MFQSSTCRTATSPRLAAALTAPCNLAIAAAAALDPLSALLLALPDSSSRLMSFATSASASAAAAAAAATAVAILSTLGADTGGAARRSACLRSSRSLTVTACPLQSLAEIASSFLRTALQRALCVHAGSSHCCASPLWVQRPVDSAVVPPLPGSAAVSSSEGGVK
eukprot:13274-Heterococcus_DN1.PRE.2